MQLSAAETAVAAAVANTGASTFSIRWMVAGSEGIEGTKRRVR